MHYIGLNGTFVIDGDHLVIYRPDRTESNGSLMMAAPRRVPLAAVTYAQLHPAGRRTPGWLNVTHGGAQPAMLDELSAVHDPDTVLFLRRHAKAFSALLDWLRHVVRVNGSELLAPTASRAGFVVGRPGVEPAQTTVGCISMVEPAARELEEDVSEPSAAPAEEVVELVWVAPPGWSQPPPGWWPPYDWTPDLDWPDAPGDHVFWRVVGPKEAAERFSGDRPRRPANWEADPPDTDTYRRWEVESDPGKLQQVDSLEHVLRSCARWRSYWAEEDVADAALGVGLPLEHPTLLAREKAWEDYAWLFADARDLLLTAVRTDTAIPESYHRRIAEYETLGDAYHAACAAVEDALSARRDEALARLTPAQRHRYWWGDAATDDEPDWVAAERLAERVLQQFGFDDAKQTGAGTDHGLDVVGAMVAAQVKYTSTPVGRPVVQQLQGAANDRITVFFARAGYTTNAISYADQRGMALFRIALPTSVTAVNQHAAAMVDGR